MPGSPAGERLSPSLEPRHYVDPDVYRHEVEAVMTPSWVPLCRADQIAEPGDQFALTMFGQPLVAVRGADRLIRVLSNVCPHRGATIVDRGSWHGSTLVCPYHRWVYRLDGSFVGAPLVEGTDLDGVCLPTVRHAVWEGFVLVNLSGDARDPGLEFAGLSAEIAPWSWSDMVTLGSRQFESTWNWKVMVENFSESLHHLGTHRQSLEPYQPARTTKLAENGAEPWVAQTLDTIKDFPTEPDEWIPGLPHDRSRELSIWAAFPMLLGGSNARTGFWVHVVPESVTRHSIIWYVVGPREHAHRHPPDLVELTLDSLTQVHEEDMEICARVQAGLASGRVDRFRLAPLERTIADFQRWIRTALDRGSAHGRDTVPPIGP